MFIINNILSLNILLSYVSYNKLRSIILKLEIKLIRAIIKDVINKTLYIKIKSGVLSAEYKKPIYKKV